MLIVEELTPFIAKRITVKEVEEEVKSEKPSDSVYSDLLEKIRKSRIDKITKIEEQSERIIETQKDTTSKKAILNNLVILFDLSISKKENGKLDKLKNSIINLIEASQPEDQLTIVAYNITQARIIETVMYNNGYDLYLNGRNIA